MNRLHVMLEDIDYVRLCIEKEDSENYILRIAISVEIRYSEKSSNYHKLLHGILPSEPDGFALFNFEYSHLDRIIEHLHEAYIDKSVYSLEDLSDCYIISHSRLLTIIHKNYNHFKKRFLKHYELDKLIKTLNYTSQNNDSVENIRHYHEERLTDYIRRINQFMV